MKIHYPLHIIGIATVSGRSRGRKIGVPTINLDPLSAPKELSHGIYACHITIGGKRFLGAMHYGQRPVFNDDIAFEVHVLDQLIEKPPNAVDLEIVAKIRDVQNFEDVSALQEAIAADITAVRGILGAL